MPTLGVNIKDSCHGFVLAILPFDTYWNSLNVRIVSNAPFEQASSAEFVGQRQFRRTTEGSAVDSQASLCNNFQVLYKASLLEFRRADSGFGVKPLYRKSPPSSSFFSRFSWRFSVAEGARDPILGHQIGTACRTAPVRRS